MRGPSPTFPWDTNTTHIQTSFDLLFNYMEQSQTDSNVGEFLEQDKKYSEPGKW